MSEPSTDSILQKTLSKNKAVNVRRYNGRLLVDIREFYVKNDRRLPGKKGISLTVDQWKQLVAHMHEIETVLSTEENSDQDAPDASRSREPNMKRQHEVAFPEAKEEQARAQEEPEVPTKLPASVKDEESAAN